MRRILLAVLSVTMLVGLVMSVDPLEDRSKGVLFNYEDSVSGHGNFASNNKITAQGPHADASVHTRWADVHLQKMNHGSGLIKRESIITSKELTENQTDPDMIYAYGLIAALGNSSMVYEPLTLSVGLGYYAAHPMNFNSLLGDEIQIKNYASRTSMGHEINYAHAINMDLVASVEDDYAYTGDSKGLAKSLMNLDGIVTSGTANLKMLQGNIDTSSSGKSDWSKPDIDVDQVYTGTFNFATKMNLTIPVTKIVSEDSWLPCCSGGWVDMMYPDKKDFGTDAKGIFDCTCPKD